IILTNRNQFLRSVYVYVGLLDVFKKCFRLNNLADPLQYLRGPPGGRGPPVEDPWTRGQSIGVYKPQGRIQMYLIQLVRQYINVLGYLSVLVTCPTQINYSSHIWPVCIWQH